MIDQKWLCKLAARFAHSVFAQRINSARVADCRLVNRTISTHDISCSLFGTLVFMNPLQGRQGDRLYVQPNIQIKSQILNRFVWSESSGKESTVTDSKTGTNGSVKFLFHSYLELQLEVYSQSDWWVSRWRHGSYTSHSVTYQSFDRRKFVSLVAVIYSEQSLKYDNISLSLSGSNI